jgi:WD40 repeat protein
MMAAGASNGSAAVWDLTTMKLVETFHLPGGASALSFSPDGKFLAAGGLDASIWLFPIDQK